MCVRVIFPFSVLLWFGFGFAYPLCFVYPSAVASVPLKRSMRPYCWHSYARCCQTVIHQACEFYTLRFSGKAEFPHKTADNNNKRIAILFWSGFKQKLLEKFFLGGGVSVVPGDFSWAGPMPDTCIATMECAYWKDYHRDIGRHLYSIKSYFGHVCVMHWLFG